MIYILLFFLLLFTYISYRQGGRHLNSPWFIVCTMLTICSCVYAIFISYMGRDISFITVFVILFGLTSWGYGQHIAWKKFKKKIDAKDIQQPSIYIIPYKVVLVCTGIILITDFFSYKYFMEIGASFGGNDFFSAYGAARMYMLEIQDGNMSVEIHKPSVLTLFEMLGSSISYYFMYVYFYSLLICNTNRRLYLLPIFSYLPVLFFATSRMAFFGLFSIAIGIYMTLRYATIGVKAANKAIMKFAIPFVLIGASIFIIGGELRGGLISEEGYSGEKKDINVDLCMYVASNIYALNYYLEGDMDFDFGAKTLNGVKQVLGRFGIQFKTRPRHYQNVKYKTGEANVFTGFKEDITDYSIYGFWIYLIILGFICGVFFYKAQNLCFAPHGVFFVVLGKLYYPIFIYFYTDDFYSMTGVDFFVPFLLLLWFDKYICKKYIQNINC